jgi:hypothetical protein
MRLTMTERDTPFEPISEPVDAQEETPDSALSAEFDALLVSPPNPCCILLTTLPLAKLSRPRLPLEIIRLIATHLTNTYALGTLAALNATCHAVHAETLCALWTRVFLDRRVPVWLEGRGRYRFFRENEDRPAGCRYTRYVLPMTEGTSWRR